MIDPQLIDAIAPYINQDKKNAEGWLERGLVDNAPDAARKAFEQYKKIQADAQKRGIEV